MVSLNKGYIETLQKRINHQFKDVSLLQEAMTHPSVANSDKSEYGYERLEFLGDRVLGLVIAELLLKKYPDDNEGDIAKRHTALVQRKALAHVAEAIDLSPNLLLSMGEVKTGGRENHAILADATEALIAAIYLDAGFEAAQKFIQDEWSGLVEKYTKPPQDPKTELQEWVQSRQLPLPTYKLVDRSGPEHQPEFKVAVSIKGYETGYGIGNSKKKAEKRAAVAMLRNLGIEKPC